MMNDERHRVEREADAGADDHDDHAGEGGADDARDLEDRAVETDRVREIVGPDHLGHERLAGRVVDRQRHAEGEHDHVQHPELDDAGEVDDREQHGDGGHRDLRCTSSTVRLSKRSARTPPHTPNSSVGTNCSAMASPMATPLLCDSCSTSQPSAIVCIHVPHCEMHLADEEQPEVARRASTGRWPRSRDVHGASSWSAFEQRAARARAGALLRRAELGDALREVGVLARAAARQQFAAGVGDRDARDAAVRGVDDARRRSPTPRAGRRCGSCSAAAPARPRRARRG